MDLLALLDTLCPPVGLPGREDEVRDVLRGLCEPWAHAMEIDRGGNLQVFINPDARPRIMLDAHMDEVGLVVQEVADKGFLRVAALGGLDQRLLPGSRVILQPRPGRHLDAVVGMIPPHVQEQGAAAKSLPWNKLFLDTGLGSAEAVAEAGVEIGTPGVLDAKAGPLGPDAYCARNLDDRAGCALLVAAGQSLAQSGTGLGVVLNFSTAEEVGLRGAATATFGLDPDLALALEATVGDTPGLEPARQPSLMGGGPAVTVSDGRVVVPWALVDSLEQAAERAGVDCQRKRPPYGGTNAGAIAQARAGVPTGVLSVPVRYLHSPVSLLNLNDFSQTFKLLMAWLEQVPDLAS